MRTRSKVKCKRALGQACVQIRLAGLHLSPNNITLPLRKKSAAQLLLFVRSRHPQVPARRPSGGRAHASPPLGADIDICKILARLALKAAAAADRPGLQR